MYQILQNLNTGEVELADVPAPQVQRGHLLIRSHVSLISAGTEKMLLDFGRGGLLDKVRSQPEKVRQVIDKVKTDGLLPTIEAVRYKLNYPVPLGYSNAGKVIAVGEGVRGFRVGDRVVSNGSHAEIVSVPQNLCAKIPEGVMDETAAFTVVAAVALQGIRLLKPTFGESFIVTGLGLIGLVAVQLLRASGCRVMGIDMDPRKLEIAREYGAETVNIANAEDPLGKATVFSNGRGVDGVLLTLSAKSDEPMHQAAQMCRKRGRIVLVGATGLKLQRSDFYEKELSFQVSCSYGPGRYDPEYEERGHDYPLAFVRWTEQRNFTAVLEAMASGGLKTDRLTTHRHSIRQAGDAYRVLESDGFYLGILLEYAESSSTLEPAQEKKEEARKISPSLKTLKPSSIQGKPVIGVIGAGNYGMRVTMPALKNMDVRLKTVVTRSGTAASIARKRFAFENDGSDVGQILGDPEVHGVFILTGHASHADLVSRALEAGKHVFVEKPLAISNEQLEQVEKAYRDRVNADSPPVLMVGYNRRFSPLILRMRKMLRSVSGPKAFIMTVNAGVIPPDNALHDPAVGGGQINGEACHFIDLLRYLADSPIVEHGVMTIGDAPGVTVRDDKVSIRLRFADGSMGTIHYLAHGHPSFPKERLEVFTGGRVLQLDNHIVLRPYGWPGAKKKRLRKQEKGGAACVAAFIKAMKEGLPSPIPFAAIEEVTRVTLALAEEARK